MDAINRHGGHARDEGELKELIELCDRLRLSVGEPAGDLADELADAASDDTPID